MRFRLSIQTVDRLAWSAMLLVCGLSAWPVAALAVRQIPEGDRRTQESPAAQRILMAAGLEVAGDVRAAESILLETAARDRRFVPAWALTSFYQRQGRSDDFWRWARQALAMSYGDRSALFQAITDQEMPEEAAALIPSSLAAEFSSFLLGRGRLNQALALRPQNDRQLGLALSERLLLAGRLDEALQLWNECGPQPVSHQKPGVVNSEFRWPPSGTGFDWRLSNAEDARAAVIHVPGQEGQLEIRFSGNQERTGEAVTQWMALQSGRRHRLSFEWKAVELTGDPGLRWGMETPTRQLNLLRDAPGLVPPGPAQPAWTHGALEFDVPVNLSFARCSLTWADLADGRRPEGTVAFRRIVLELAE